MHGIGLDVSARFLGLFGITHGDEGRDDWDVILRGEDESAWLQRFWFAVVPPHRLLWVDEDEVAFLEDGINGLEEIPHDGWVRR